MSAPRATNEMTFAPAHVAGGVVLLDRKIFGRGPDRAGACVFTFAVREDRIARRPVLDHETA